jgi:sRNA-binding carbon storage regulator CsrA
MLVLTVKPDGTQWVHIGEAKVKIVTRKSSTKLYIDAPKDTIVLRDKVKQRLLATAEGEP